MTAVSCTTRRCALSGPRRIPLYEQVANRLRVEIAERYQPGDKMESGPKIAKRLGVSVLTVREAVNALTQEGLVERTRGSGTFVRRAGHPVAILVGLTPDNLRHSYFFLHLVHQIEARLQAEHIACRQYFAYPGGGRSGDPVANSMFLDDLEAGRLSAVLPISQTPDSSLRNLLQARRIPLIDFAGVQTDYEGMVDAAIGWLLANGRRRIALLHAIGGTVRQHFERGLQANGLVAVSPWMRFCSAEGVGPNAPHAVIRELWEAQPAKPDGLICLSDVAFEQAAPALLQLGVRVPDDLMVAVHANRNSGIRYPFPVARMELDPDTYALELAAIVKRVQRNPTARPEPTIVRHRWIPESRGDSAAVYPASAMDFAGGSANMA